MKNRGKSMGWAALGIGMFLGLAYLLLPSMNPGLGMGVALRAVNEARNLAIASQQAAIDRQQNGQDEIGLPFDVKSRTSTEYVQNLVSHGYLRQTDLTALQTGKFVFANASSDDSPDTILIVSRSYYDAVILKKGPLKGAFVVMCKNGEGSARTLQRPSLGGKLPPRDPPFLAP